MVNMTQTEGETSDGTEKIICEFCKHALRPRSLRGHQKRTRYCLMRQEIMSASGTYLEWLTKGNKRVKKNLG